MTDKERGRVIYFLLALLMLFELVVLFVRSGSFSGISKRTDILKAYASAALEDIRIIPGDILDRNGDPVVENRIDIVETEDAEDQKSEKTEEKRVTEYSYFWETNTRNPRTHEEDCTALKSNNGQWDQDVMIFDSHGYLLEYNLSNTYLEYYYE